MSARLAVVGRLSVLFGAVGIFRPDRSDSGRVLPAAVPAYRHRVHVRGVGVVARLSSAADRRRSGCDVAEQPS